MCVISLTSLCLSGQTCSGSSCSVTPDHSLGSNISTNASRFSTSGLGTTLDNLTILICGDFIIDDDITSVFSNFVMMEDSRIILEDGSSLILNECTVYGCDGMWQSITVQGGASMHINNSTLSDAYIAAVDAEPGANVLIRQTTFDRNHISFLVEGPNTLVGSDKCTYLATEFNFNFPGGGDGNNNGVPWIGIDVHNASMFFGNDSRPLRNNRVEGPFEFGIRTDNSIVRIEKSEFIDQAFQRNGDWLGTSISSQNRSIHTISNNTFDNTYTAIESHDQNSSIAVQDNTFTEYTFAVHGTFSAPARGVVQNNQIGSDALSGHFGVVMTQLGSALITVGNVIYVDSRDGQDTETEGGAGIRHTGGAAGLGEIIGNDITLIYPSYEETAFRAGIMNNGQNNTNIFENNIQIASSGVRFDGIILLDANFNRVEDNRIVADQKGLNFGMNISDASRVKYCCNVDSLVRTGISFFGNCDGSDFRANEIYDCSIGLFLWSSAFLGRQNLTGNRWRGTFSSAGARHMSTDPIVFQLSRFVVPSIDQPEGPGSVFPLANWFIENSSSDDTPCGSLLSTECGEGPGMTPGLTDYDTLFSAGALDTLLDEGDAWTKAQQLYTIMSDYPALYGVYDVTDDWYDNQAGDVVEAYYLVHDSIKRLFVIDSLQQDTIDRAMDSISIYFTELRYIDSLIFSDTVTNWDSYNSLHRATIQKVDSVYGIYLNTLDNIIADRSSHAQSMINTNANLSTPDLPTRYEQMYNGIFLQTVASNVDTFSQAQTDSLYVMASACPSNGGRAVYMAGALYQSIEHTNFDIQTQCNPPSPLPSSTKSNALHANEMRIIPNPAEDRIQLTRLDSETSSSSWSVTIFNMAGAVVWSGNPGSDQSIYIGYLPAGIYSIVAVSENREVYRSKFIIQR